MNSMQPNLYLISSLVMLLIFRHSATPAHLYHSRNALPVILKWGVQLKFSRSMTGPTSLSICNFFAASLFVAPPLLCSLTLLLALITIRAPACIYFPNTSKNEVQILLVLNKTTELAAKNLHYRLNALSHSNSTSTQWP